MLLLTLFYNAFPLEIKEKSTRHRSGAFAPPRWRHSITAVIGWRHRGDWNTNHNTLLHAATSKKYKNTWRSQFTLSLNPSPLTLTRLTSTLALAAPLRCQYKSLLHFGLLARQNSNKVGSALASLRHCQPIYELSPIGKGQIARHEYIIDR